MDKRTALRRPSKRDPKKRRSTIIPASEKATHRGCAKEIIRIKKQIPNASNALIARTVGCTRGNVRSVLSTFLGKHSEEELRDFQENKANIVDALQLKALESITDRKLTKSSAAQLATMFGILYDKGALQRGQPTGINAVMLLDVVEAIKARQQ